MARWLEQLQEYDFAILHRQGKKHTNADSLSWIPCKQCGCEAHTERPKLLTIATVNLASREDFAQLQLDDDSIGPVLKAKVEGNKPSDTQMQPFSRSTRRLFQLWDQLLVQHGRLYRQFLDSDDNTMHLQLLIPRCKQGEVLKQMHEGTLGGGGGASRRRQNPQSN